MEIDQDNLRTLTAIGCRASHKLLVFVYWKKYFVSPVLRR